MENPKPSWAEARLVAFPTGVGGMIALAAWADVSSRNLWNQTWFQVIFGLVALIAVLGIFGFVAHWKVRSIPLILMAITAGWFLAHVAPIWG